MDPEKLYELGVASRKNGMVTVRDCWRCGEEYPEWNVLSTTRCPECRTQKALDRRKALSVDATNRSASTTTVMWCLN